MHIFHSIEEIPADFGPSVVTIGNFDGVHRGHQAVLQEVMARARALHARSIAVTFDPHPARILRPQTPLRLITQQEQKLAWLAHSGIDAVLVLPFTHELSRLTAREFARTILRDALKAIEVHEGDNFRFGADAGADVNDLSSLGEGLGFKVHVHPPTHRRGKMVSSSAVRGAIAAGNMRAARQLLGRPFQVIATPAAGRGYGSRYTVPTINLAPYKELLPANGVYITCLEVNGERFASVSNVGNRPTFGSDSFAVEAHILDFHPIALDESTKVRLSFLSRLRPEIAWPSPEALKEQIGKDIARARHYFALYQALFGLNSHT
ncbi:MAG TPA: bifunctional riboflavin kinase/FAD synthetase [Acidobacteriaceae bacterium]|nr:bifunctional riboflavin kinase/FAD synthetase [Acidobacteriaceae bacterium]